jgi:hypothetical protein
VTTADEPSTMSSPARPPKNWLIVFCGIIIIGVARARTNAPGRRWVPQSTSPQRATLMRRTHQAAGRAPMRRTPASVVDRQQRETIYLATSNLAFIALLKARFIQGS